MPAVIMQLTEASKPKAVSIHQTLGLAQAAMTALMGNPNIFYNVREISQDRYTQAVNRALDLPKTLGKED